MTPRRRGALAKAAARTVPERYGIAVLLTAAALLAMFALLELTDEPLYGPMFVALAASVWYGGLGPALVTLVLKSIAEWRAEKEHKEAASLPPERPRDDSAATA